MKKIGIVTINDCNNYGNRLQAYAMQKYINSIPNCNVLHIRNYSYLNEEKNYYLRYLKYFTNFSLYSKIKGRKYNFKKFENNISYCKKKYTAKTKKLDFDYMIVGSDQIWNPNFGRLRKVDLLTIFSPEKRISYAASFGISSLAETNIDLEFIKKELKNFKKISVREDDGKKIIRSLTGSEDVEVLIDPTLLLKREEWVEISKKPIFLNQNASYILLYFLGDISVDYKKEIDKLSKDYNYEIINLMDVNSIYHECGPSEFIYLINNAKVILTDSFHASVFSFIFNKPFIVFSRNGNVGGNMNSRITTFINKFKLKDRIFNGTSIEERNLNCNYDDGYIILNSEREKSRKFIYEALDIKNGDENGSK